MKFSASLERDPSTSLGTNGGGLFPSLGTNGGGAAIRSWAVRSRSLKAALAIPALTLLSGCDWVVMSPAGDVARQQADLILIATGLMLLIIVPVMAATVWFAWHYRAANTEARYEPEWNHSTKLELMIWSAPLLIIIALGAVTWVGTHLLDPYRSIGRLDHQRAVPKDAKPLDVQVVALDWKWLFIYPEQQIATVNELVIPTDRPLRFRITASSVMNSFYAPALAGQIYAMPGMETKLHAVLNKEGDFGGFSANYSGAGFSGMRFALRGVSPQGFDAWAAGVKAKQAAALDRASYLVLERPSEREPVRHFASVAPDLFDAVVNMCVRPGKMCMSQMMALDAKGGTGKAGNWNLAALTYDKHGRESLSATTPARLVAANDAFVKAYCENTPSPVMVRDVHAPASTAPLRGAGLRWTPAGQALPPAASEHMSLATPPSLPLS